MRIGRITMPRAPNDYSLAEETRFRSIVEDAIETVRQPLRLWTVTQSPSMSRTYDPNTATLSETQSTLAQLLIDLKEKGVLG